MENYKAGMDMRKYLSKENLVNSSYNLGEYRQTYTRTSLSQDIYNNFVRSIPPGSHIGRYETPK